MENHIDNNQNNKSDNNYNGRMSFGFGLSCLIYSVLTIAFFLFMVANLGLPRPVAQIIALIAYLFAILSPLMLVPSIFGIVQGTKQRKIEKTKQAVLGIIFSCTIFLIPLSFLITWLVSIL